MRMLALVCLLLSLCVSFSGAKPSPQDDHGSWEGSKCAAGMKECKESLNDFKDAEKFMQLKATVYADLTSAGPPAPNKPQFAAVTDANLGRRANGNTVRYKTIVHPNRISVVPATTVIQPVSLKSSAEPAR